MDPAGFRDFSSAATAVLEFLQQRLGFDLWMVTRTEGENWIVLEAADRGYGVGPQKVFRWSDSFCSRMVEGEGPRIAPRSDDVAAYREAPIGRQVEIGAYVGVPLVLADGSLFGTLCAIDPGERSDTLTAELPMVELFAGLLSSVLQRDLEASDSERRYEQVARLATLDPLTGLANRRGWDDALGSEEERCRRFGHAAAVWAIDLDNLKQVNDDQGHAAGDALLCRTAVALRAAVRAHDVVARVGGDEFAVLAVEAGLCTAGMLDERLAASLAEHGVEASIGCAGRRADAGGLPAAWEDADRAMYEVKRRRQEVAEAS